MEYVTKEIKLPKELSEASDKIVELVRIIKEESKDGFGPGDISPILAGAVGAIGEISDFTLMQEEVSSDPEASAKVVADLAAGILGVLAS